MPTCQQWNTHLQQPGTQGGMIAKVVSFNAWEMGFVLQRLQCNHIMRVLLRKFEANDLIEINENNSRVHW